MSIENRERKVNIVQKKYILRSLIEAADYVSELGFEDHEEAMIVKPYCKKYIREKFRLS